MRQVQRTGIELSRWREGGDEGTGPPTPSTTTSGTYAYKCRLNFLSFPEAISCVNTLRLYTTLRLLPMQDSSCFITVAGLLFVFVLLPSNCTGWLL